VTVAERIKQTCRKDSLKRFMTCLKECMVFTSEMYEEVCIVDALFVDGSTLVVRVYLFDSQSLIGIRKLGIRK
jgi:hypothetical protein